MTQPESKAKSVEESIRAFYDSEGWASKDGVSKDAALWEDTRDCAREYVSGCRLRVRDYLPPAGDRLLDAASGPVQYPEYLAYSEGFKTRVCVDVSKEALAQAEKRLGARGEYVNCSLLELPFPDDFADASISLHTVYHIESDAQETAVRQLLRVTKVGRPLLIVYANPDRLSARLANVARGLKRIFTGGRAQPQGEVYYHAHPLAWWSRFSDVADVELVVWRTFTAKLSRRLIPDNFLGSVLLRLVLRLEESFPRALLPFAAYPMVILRKRRHA